MADSKLQKQEDREEIDAQGRVWNRLRQWALEFEDLYDVEELKNTFVENSKTPMTISVIKRRIEDLGLNLHYLLDSDADKCFKYLLIRWKEKVDESWTIRQETFLDAPLSSRFAVAVTYKKRTSKNRSRCRFRCLQNFRFGPMDQYGGVSPQFIRMYDIPSE